MEESSSSTIFSGDIYYIVATILSSLRTELRILLKSNSATEADSIGDANIIITDSLAFEGSEDIGRNVTLATTKWILKSVAHEKRQDPKFYSPDPCMIFSGVVGCSSDIPSGDREAIAGGIQALGGQWRQGLTKDVTHLFALSPNGEKYQTAMEHKDALEDLAIVLPHWFDDSFSVQQCLRVAPYCFPDPPILRPEASLDNLGLATLPNVDGQTSDTNNKSFRGDRKRAKDQAVIYRTVLMADGATPSSAREPKEGVWAGRRILLSRELEIDEGRRGAIEKSIDRGSGYVVKYGSEKEVDVSEYDVLVTRWKEGDEYQRASVAHKIIGTLAWFFHVEQTSKVTMPEDQFLHVPIPKQGIPGFSEYTITVTNYSGESREYLKKLIQAVGAKFSPTFSARHSHVIAAFKRGSKTTKAEEWNVPVINHTWIEDCFATWTNINLTSGGGKYVHYPKGVNYATILGERGFGRSNLVNQYPLPLPDKSQAASPSKSKPAPRPPSPTPVPPISDVDASAAGKESVRDAMEVEDVMIIDNDRDEFPPVDLGGPMNIDPPTPKNPPKERPRPRPVAKKPTTPLPPPKSRRETMPIPSTSQTDLRHPYDTPSHSKSSPSMSSNRSPTGMIVEVAVPPLGSRSNLSTPRRSTDSSPAQRTVSAIAISPMVSSPLKRTSTDPSALRTAGSRNFATPKDRGPLSSLSERSPGSARLREKAQELSTSGRPRRSAASLAAQRLHDTIMPDVLNYEKENKESQGDVRLWTTVPSGLEKRSRTETDDDSDVQELTSLHRARKSETLPSKYRRVGLKEKVKPKSKSSSESDGFEEEDDEDDNGSAEIIVKKKPSSGTRVEKEGKSVKKVRIELEEGSDSEPSSLNLSKSASVTLLAKPSKKTVKVMTTMLTLSDADIKGLTQLGVKMTTNPRDCTHLISKQFSRTEKFLCSIPFCSYVLNATWIHESIAAKKLLDERPFVLHDPEAERKYSFKLSESLSRAKNHPILDGHTFYVTIKGKTYDTIKAIVAAHGGKVVNQTPTIRGLSGYDNRHVVSSPDDKHIWASLSGKDIPIYTQELIYTGVLVQKIDWDGFKVDEST